ncbi:MAG: glycosyl transferase family 1 [Bacteroidales bacterium]|nr:glycosyl transferase family 1 [Bacteroidales bacterium]
MKRVLIISYYWPPSGGSGVQRWVKFSKYLPTEGWQPVIYTPLNPEMPARDESLLAEIPPEAEILKTRIREPYNLYKRISGRGKTSIKEVNLINADKKSWTKRLSLWIRGNFFVPDPHAGWIRPSVRVLCKYLKDNPVDAVVSTGPPHSMHLIARNLMRELRKQGLSCPKWIADFRDPWTRMFYFKHLELGNRALKKHYEMEKSVLDEADIVISVSPPVRDEFAAMTDTPVELITNGYDETDFPEGTVKVRPDCFAIVHTGLFAADGNPLKLWKVLAELSHEYPEFATSLRIFTAGKTDAEIIAAITAAGLKRNLEDCGYQAHNKVVEMQRSAALLILPLRQEPEYAKVLPGKIFEYLAARRPVLGIGQEDGAAATLLASCGAGAMYEWNEEARVKDFVLTEWKRWRAGKREPLPEDVSRFSRQKLTAQLIELLEK